MTAAPIHSAVAALLRALLLSALALTAATARAGDTTPPLGNTHASPRAAAQAFLDALEAQDWEALGATALDETEFASVVWPELPASRPERNLTVDYVWGTLHQKSVNALRFTLSAFGGRRLELRHLRFAGETTEYRSYRVHRDTRVVVHDASTGRERELSLFGSMIERDGRYKLFSFRTER